MLKTNLTLLCCIAAALGLQAQIAFTDQTSLLSATAESFYPAAVVDMNDDGLDDVVILDGGSDVYIEYQQPDGSFVSSGLIIDFGGSADWGWAIADVDGNGHRDICSGGAYNGVKLLTADDAAGSSFTNTSMPGSGLFVQCTNFADIDNNGDIDFFACHDDAESRIWTGDGAGTFVEANSLIDMATVPASDNSGNYGSTFTDVDRDGDLDLYISKCRGGASSTTDPRRINQLFINDGAGGWTEDAAARGVASGEQTWASDFADFDNDGDFDLVMQNHTGVDIVLYSNDGNGYFTEFTGTSDLVGSGFGVEVKCADFDNDGDVDILFAGINQVLWSNDGDMTFTQVASPGIPYLSTLAVGDLNNDGFPDVYGDPSGANNVLYMNSANSNNWFKVELEGTTSNIDGIGALVEIHGSWGVQVRELRAGESYGIVNSFIMMFGLGTASSIDSVVIYWPSGTVDVITSPAINQTLSVVEGAGAVACSATSVVTNLVSVPASNSVNVSWTPLTNALGYEASGRILGTSTFRARTTTMSSLTVTNLQPNTTYEWRIRAKCTGSGIITPYSSLESFTTLTLRLAGTSEAEVWPVPARDWIRLEAPDLTEADYVLRIEDMSGRLHRQEVLSWLEGQVLEIGLQKLPAGQYLLSLSNEHERAVRQFLVE